MDDEIADLLLATNPGTARSFFSHWEEKRSASLADAQKIARERAASEGHLSAIRGQLRYHLGELALRDAAAAAGIGAMPMATVMPGAKFMLARVGRFGIVSIKTNSARRMPAASKTRKLLARPNDIIDPQQSFLESPFSHKPMELAYLGCLVVVPSTKDPREPSELFFAVPNAQCNRWINKISLTRLHALLLDRDAAGAGKGVAPSVAVQDNAFPTIKLPKTDESDTDQSSS